MSAQQRPNDLHPLVTDGAVTVSSFRLAQRQANKVSKPVEVVLNASGVLSDEKLAEYYSTQLGLPICPASNLPHKRLCDETLNPDFLRKHMVLPIKVSSEEAVIGFVNPGDQTAVRGLAFAIKREVTPVVLKAGDWKRMFLRLYESAEVVEPSIAVAGDDLLEQDRDAPIVRKVAGASDIHIEARRDGLEVRFRVDGLLRLVAQEPREIANSVLARIKVITGLDLGERRRPQDGRATIVVRGRRLDVRASVIPAIDGESVVLRLLDRPDGLLSFEGLGFDQEQARFLTEIVQQSHGLFLVSGPTGSGKTTTLYTCLETLRDKGLKILSVEDPVEYHFDHVTQVQVSEKSGVDFAESLRSFLRHDPEVIMVGEIRDKETARTAVQAAFSGHFVIASIHAIDAIRVVSRLEDMGVDGYKLRSCLIGSMAQRLPRRLCPHCRVPRQLKPDEIDLYAGEGLPIPENLYEPHGCEECGNEGFKGRVAICQISTTISESTSSLLSDGLKKAARGMTSFSELMKLEQV